MMNSLTKFSIKSFLIAFAMLFAFTGAPQQAQAQPGGYCNIWPPPDGYNYTRCYSYLYGYLSNFKVVEQSTGQTVFERSSGDDNCQYYGADIIDLKIGRTYDVYITQYVPYNYSWYWYGSSRFFIDWNMNGNWKDQGEYLGYQTKYGRTTRFKYTFTIPCTVPIGMTRVRALVGYRYYNNTNDACRLGWIWGTYYYYVYGEAEDYVFNFLPDIDDQFPGQDDILDVNTDYDDSDADHPKPFAKMGAVQPSGTVLNFKITGPRPSTSVVYEGIDPNSGSPNIDMGGYAKYTMQAARGPYAANNGDGTLRGTRGGEYLVSIEVSGSGCPGASYAAFTISWTMICRRIR